MTDNEETRAARDGSRVAVVTCAEFPDLEADDRLLLGPLAARGIAAEPVVWDAPGIDWSTYDLAVLRSPWDYVPRREEFVAWARSVPRLANPSDIVEWNTDKRYLGNLAAAGARTVPTMWLAPGDAWAAPATGEFVIKPAVSAGSKNTGRYDLGDDDQRRVAVEHVDRLLTAGRVVMVQPYLSAVDDVGETALLFLAGPNGLAFSHAIRKGPLLTGPDLGGDGLYKAETIDRGTASAAELDTARRVLAAVPGGSDRLLYARVDLIPGPDGAPLLVELELTEPSLFLGYDDGAPARFAEAIAMRLA
ncbi:MAG TPA: hypothetical protein VHN18_04280 [Micromonosporaceae bacterium]|nr:hypothetical protein [Micromonosporaceae bacterium]